MAKCSNKMSNLTDYCSLMTHIYTNHINELLNDLTTYSVVVQVII